MEVSSIHCVAKKIKNKKNVAFIFQRYNSTIKSSIPFPDFIAKYKFFFIKLEHPGKSTTLDRAPLQDEKGGIMEDKIALVPCNAKQALIRNWTNTMLMLGC